MPDENKFSKLREIGYSIPVTCKFCAHSARFFGSEWSTCDKHKYEHKKHTGPARGVSIHAMGTCRDAELPPERAARTGALGAHAEFLQAKPVV